MDYYCAISGNEPSSVALLKPATKARLLYCNFENLHDKSKTKTQFPKRGQIISTLLRKVQVSKDVSF